MAENLLKVALNIITITITLSTVYWEIFAAVSFRYFRS
jgi:hypothetical protein